jgi:hypothetical protein
MVGPYIATQAYTLKKKRSREKNATNNREVQLGP